MKKYERYMIFAWANYDNASPFDCVIGSYHFAEIAKSVSADIFSSGDFKNICVFDRIEGVIVYELNSNED